MDLATFFQKFDQFADAPDAVAKMRELALALAVQGKFVPQVASDEPASHLLSRIDAERNQLVRAKKIRHHDLLGPIAEADIPFPVPQGWDWRHLADVCFLITDGAHHTPQYQETGVPFLSVKDVSSGTIDFSHTRYITPDAHRELCKRCQPERGDILLTKVGTTGIAVTVDDSREFSIFVSLSLLKFSQANLDGQFLKYLINSPFVRKQSADNTQGIGNKNLVLRLINQFKVPIPPLAEQKRIVAKVDELMALCDRLEAQQQERETRHAALARASLARFAEAPTPANLDFLFHSSFSIPPSDLRKSILTLAVQGKLVPQDPNDEPAEELLKTILKQREKLLGSASLRKTKICREFTPDEAPHDIPETWTWTMLGEITDIGTGSTPSRTEPSFWVDGTIPWITSGSTSHSPITEGDELVTDAAVKAHRLRIYPSGTLLVALYGQGKTRGQVAALEIPATINQACAAICPLDGIPPMQGYLKLLLEKQYDEMRSLSAGGAQPNLNVQKIKEVFIPLAPLAEQRRIVAKVDQLMALVDALEQQLAAGRATAANLLSALVAELTFAGPTTEPESELMAAEDPAPYHA
jgi:type I restriction enzyme, S subunit